MVPAYVLPCGIEDISIQEFVAIVYCHVLLTNRLATNLVSSFSTYIPPNRNSLSSALMTTSEPIVEGCGGALKSIHHIVL